MMQRCLGEIQRGIKTLLYETPHEWKNPSAMHTAAYMLSPCYASLGKQVGTEQVEKLQLLSLLYLLGRNTMLGQTYHWPRASAYF